MLILLALAAFERLFSHAGERHFHRDSTNALPRACAFFLSFALIAAVRSVTADQGITILLADRYAPGFGPASAALLAFWAAWLTGRLHSPGAGPVWRLRMWSLFSGVFFLQLLLGVAGLEDMLMTGKLHLPVPALILGGPLFRGEGFFMLALFSITVLLVGPAWCSHLCYIGAWDGLCAGGVRPSKSRTLPRGFRHARAFTLAGTILLALGLRSAGIDGGTAVLAAAAFGIGGIAVMLLVSRRTGTMVHCTAWCPMGLATGILGRISPWRLRIHSGCTHCGACIRACRYGALDREALAAGRPNIRCTLCGDCLSACSHRQIGYSLPLLHPNTARTIFLVMVVSLHALFLAVARL